MSTETPTRSLKERQREERERLIIQAAIDLLLEKGYHEMSMDEVAARVGISKGTVYLHFPSKEDLILAVLHQDRQRFQHMVEQILASAASPRAKLHSLLEYVYGGMLSKSFQVFTSVYQNPELRARLIEKKDEFIKSWAGISQRMADVLDEGKAQGDFDPAIPTPVMLSIFLSLMTPRNYDQVIVQEHVPPDEMVRHVSHVFFKGIAAPGAPEGNEA